MFVKRLFLAIVFVLSLGVGVSGLSNGRTVHAQHDNTLYSCEFQTGELAGQRFFGRYQPATAQFEMVSLQTGQARILETGLVTSQVDVRGWSHDCRYIVASLGPWGSQELAAWDVLENRRVGGMALGGIRYATLHWSPANDYRFIAESLNGAYLWHLPSNTQTHLANTIGEPTQGRSFHHLDNYYYGINPHLWWDTARNQVLTVNLGPSENGVSAYDLSTGQLVAYYGLGDNPGPAYMLFFQHTTRYIAVFPDGTLSNVHYTELGGMIFYDRDAGSSWRVTADIRNRERKFFISPDGRYIAAAGTVYTGGGYTVPLYLWDLQNLSDSAPHVANHTYSFDFGYNWDVALVTDVRFLATEIEIFHYWWYDRCQYEFTIYRWDRETEEVTYKQLFNNAVCQDPSLLPPDADLSAVEWACTYECPTR